MRGHREATWVAVMLLAAVGCRVAWAQPPAISYVTQPVRHWETFFLFGEGFGAGNVQVLRGELRDARSPEQLAQALAAGDTFTPPVAPPEDVGDLFGRQFVLTPQVIAGKLQGAVQVFWVKTRDGVSRPYVVNRPEPFFAEFDDVAPGQECRLFGRNMVQSFHPPSPSLWLIDRAAKRAFACEWGNRFDYQGHLDYQLPYELRFKVPDTVPDGAYELWVHNGLKTGLHAFGGPVPLAVTRTRRPERKRLDVRDFGAKGDGRSDDAEAIERAALAAADEGGGVLFLPQGDYVLSRTVRVPPGVDLEGLRPELSRIAMRPEASPFSPDLPKEPLKGKGEDWARHFRRLEGPPLVHLVSNSRVENLGFVAAEPAYWAIAAARVQGAIERIAIRHCNLVNSHAPWVGGKWRPATACIALLGNARFCEVRGCSLQGMNGIGHVGTGYRCRTIANTFNPVGGPFGTTGMGWMIGVECLIEGNVCDGSNRGFTCGPWMGPIERNFIARNGVVNGGSVEGGAESFLFEGPDVGRENWLGHPTAAGADWLEQADQKWKPDVLKDRVALVVHGRGFGQWRRVRANTENRATLSEPWATEPDQDSLVVIRNFFMQNVLLNNYCRDAVGGVDFYGGALENTVERFVGLRSRGVWWYAAHVADPAQRLPFGPCWYNEARNCRFVDGDGVQLEAARRTDMPTPALLLCGNRVHASEFRHSAYVTSSKMLWSLRQTSWLPYGDARRGNPPPAIAWNILDSSRFTLHPGERGIDLDPETAGQLLWHLDWSGNPPEIRDSATGTLIVPR